MNQHIQKIFLGVIFAVATGIPAHGSVRSKDLIVEFPADLPEVARIPSEAMYLHHTGAAQAILYLEQDHGRKLAILDVTDPANIKLVGQVSVGASAPYDFVQSIGDTQALVHFRDHSGFGVITFKDYKQPFLTNAPNYLHPAQVQRSEGDSVILTSAKSATPSSSKPQYEILSVSNSSDPKPLATIQDVTQRLDRPQTGTIFLLNSQGLTVVRSLAAEQEHRVSVDWKDSN